MNDYHRHPGDDLLSMDARLKYKWKWCRVASGISREEIKKWTHFQSSYCQIGAWTLEAIQWGGADNVRYEAAIRYGETIASREGFKTRIEAQIAAEKLLSEWIEKQYKEIVL